MDYHSLKRKELQALCKKHNIPANSTNSVMADKLSALLNEKQKPITKQRTCMKSTIETTEENEPASLKRQKKKVRFSPTNDLVVYALRSGEKQKDMVPQIKTRRKSVANKVENPVVNNTASELVNDDAQVPVKLTRSRVQSSGNYVAVSNIEKKQTRSVAKDVKNENDADQKIVGNVRKATRLNARSSKIDGDVPHEEIRKSKMENKDAGKTSESVVKTVVSGTRATRSRIQTIKENSGHAVTDIPAVKKRTRKEMKATDMDSNTGHVNQVDKKEPIKRKSLRTREMETVDEDEGDKVEVVKVGRVARSKAPLEMEASRRNTRNKANKVEVQQIEESSKNASKKNVNRRKSVLQPDKTEPVLHLEEPVNRPDRKNTRRKSVMQKVSPVVESPDVGKQQSKGRFGNLSVIESSEGKENVTRSGNDASENEFKDSTTVSPKSRKRRGTSVIEDPVIEPEYKSPKISTRSAKKSEEKSVERKSGLKKSVSRMNNQLSVENASHGKSSTLRSGAITRDGSSNKRAKLVGMKQSDSEDHNVNLSKMGTPVANMGSFRDSSSKETAKARGSKISQSDSKDVGVNSSKAGTPVANMVKLKSDEELTEAEVTPAISKSERRFTRSAIKEQPIIADARLTSPKAVKFKYDPAVNTAPGRITRRGTKLGGNPAGSFSEKVGKIKQKKQSLDDAQMTSLGVPEVGPNLDVGIKGDSSEIKQSLSPVEVVETILDDVLDGSHVQNQNVEACVESGIFTEGVNLESSVPESEKPDAKEKETELTESGSVSKVMQTDVMIEEPVVSVGKEVVIEESVNISSLGDDDNNCDFISYDVNSSVVSYTSIQQSDVADDGEQNDEDRDVADLDDDQEMDIVAGDYDVESNKDDPLEKLTVDNNLQGNDTEVNIVTARDSSTYHSDAADDTGKQLAKEHEFDFVSSTSNIIFGKSEGEDDSVDAVKDPSTSFNVVQDPLLSDGNGEDDGVNPVSLPDIDAYDGVNEPKELETGSELLNITQTVDIPDSCNDDVVECGFDNLEEDAGGDMPVVDEVSVRSCDQELEPDQMLNVAVDDNTDEQDGESEHEQLLNDDNLEEDVGGDMPVVDEVLVGSCDQESEPEPEQTLNNAVDDDVCDMVIQPDSVTSKDTSPTLGTSGNDDMDKSALDINKDLVSSILGDTYDMDAEDDLVNEQRLTESDDGFQPKESGGDSVSEKDSFPITYNKAKSPVDDTDPDLLTFKEDEGNKQGTSVDWGDYDFEMDEFEKPMSVDGIADVEGEGKTDDQYSDGMSNSLRNLEKGSTNVADGKSNQESDMLKESEKAVDVTQEGFDWSGADSALKSLFTTPAITQIRHEKSSQDDAVDFSCQDHSVADSSLKRLFKTPAATQMSQVKVGQDDAVSFANQDPYSSLKQLFATPSTTQITHVKDVADSSLKSLFKTPAPAPAPATTKISHVKGAQEDAYKFDNQDHLVADSSLKQLFKTPATISQVKVGQEDANSFANQDPYSSLKLLFPTPSTTQITHVKDGQVDSGTSANQDPYSTLGRLFKTPAPAPAPATATATTKINHVKDAQEDTCKFDNQDHYSSLKSLFTTASSSRPSHDANQDIWASGSNESNHQWNGETQNNAVPGSENEMYGVQSFEYDPLNLFGDEEVGGGRNTHSEFKGDHQIKQFEFLSETAGTSHLHPSGFKDESTHSGEIEKENETVMKVSETDDHLAFDTRQE